MGISFSNFGGASGSGIPYGTNSDRPENPEPGQPFFNGDEARLEMYTSTTGWQSIVQENPAVISVSGLYIEGNPSNTIVINGTGFGPGAIAYAIGTNNLEIPADLTILKSAVEVNATFSGLEPANEPYDIKIVNPSKLYAVLSDGLQVDDIPVFITQSGTLGTYIEESSMSVQISATDDENSPLIFSITSGELPSGLSLNSSTGEISGTPSDIIPNSTYSFDISATDGNNTASRSFSITINDRGPTWSTSETISSFSKNIAYSEILVALDDNLQSVSYDLISGSLPAGLSLNSVTGEISGTTASDTSSIFTIRATDASGNYTDKQFTIPNTGPSWQTPQSIEVFTSSNSIQLSAIDDSGIDPTYSIVSGALPAGMSFSTTGLLTGATSGNDGDTATFTVRATDNNGAFSDRQFTATTRIVIYSFESHTFTNASTAGPNGPTLSAVRSAYSSTSWANTYLQMSVQGIQRWTVPRSGTYRIEIAGASSVRQRFSNSVGTGYGRGAKFTADVLLTAGDVLDMLVGQLPRNGGDFVTDYDGQTYSGTECFNGGGGGTFISKNSNLILAAGGGGSNRQGQSFNQTLIDARMDFNATGNNGTGGTGGTAGAGGIDTSSGDNGTSGAGFSGSATVSGFTQYSLYSEAQSFLNGGRGALYNYTGNTPKAEGGFGGGGAGGYGGCGGGGGYSGGGAGSNTEPGYGGGGANYYDNSVASIVTNPSARSGAGYITITKL